MMSDNYKKALDILAELNEKMRQLWRELLREKHAGIPSQPFTIYKNLFHYTTVQGLFGIIESQCFWLTNIQYMNDLSENTHARTLIKNILNEISTKNKYPEGFSKYLKAEYLNQTDIFGPDYNKNYIACFTNNGDSLPMWIMYGKDCGVAIEIDLASEYQFTFAPKCFFRDMLYDEIILQRFVETAVDMYCGAYIELKADENIDDYIIDDIMENLPRDIIIYTINVKNKSFSHESETRLLYTATDCDKIKYRVKNNFIISYVEMPPRQLNGDKKLPIKSIIVGPGEEQDIVKASISDFIKSKGYNDIEIKSSIIPYRSR